MRAGPRVYIGRVERSASPLSLLAQGRLPVAQVAGVTEAELARVRRLAVARFQAGECGEAASLFGLLVLLEPCVPEHWLCLGFAEAERGQSEAACVAVGRYLDCPELTDLERARGLLFRTRLAALITGVDVERDLAEVARLTARTPSVRELLEQLA